MPAELKALYKTSWEIKQKVLVDMAADRGAFIDQSQSFNVFMQSPNFGKLTSMHFYSWRKGAALFMAVVPLQCGVRRQRSQSLTLWSVGQGSRRGCTTCAQRLRRTRSSLRSTRWVGVC